MGTDRMVSHFQWNVFSIKCTLRPLLELYFQHQQESWVSGVQNYNRIIADTSFFLIKYFEKCILFHSGGLVHHFIEVTLYVSVVVPPKRTLQKSILFYSGGLVDQLYIEVVPRRRAYYCPREPCIPDCSARLCTPVDMNTCLGYVNRWGVMFVFFAQLKRPFIVWMHSEHQSQWRVSAKITRSVLLCSTWTIFDHPVGVSDEVWGTSARLQYSECCVQKKLQRVAPRSDGQVEFSSMGVAVHLRSCSFIRRSSSSISWAFWSFKRRACPSLVEESPKSNGLHPWSPTGRMTETNGSKVIERRPWCLGFDERRPREIW